MFKTREEIQSEFERMKKEKPELTGIYEEMIQALEKGFTDTLQSTSVAAITLGFKKTLHVQGLVLLNMYLYAVNEASKFQEKESGK